LISTCDVGWQLFWSPTDVFFFFSI
jgi:hypothetical protein